MLALHINSPIPPSTLKLHCGQDVQIPCANAGRSYRLDSRAGVKFVFALILLDIVRGSGGLRTDFGDLFWV
eukprot:1043264-Amphidinium_carterae.1